MEDMTTRDYAERIAESMTNGQRKQARSQFTEAMAADCSARALLTDIAEIAGHDEALALAATIITNS